MRIRLTHQSRMCHKLGLEFDNVSFSGYCLPDFDMTFCWNTSAPDTFNKLECPWEFCDHCPLKERHAVRYCDKNGEWQQTNYDYCKKLLAVQNDTHCLSLTCDPCPSSSWFKDMVTNLTLYLSVVSLLLLCFTLLIFSVYRSLHCMRITIHKHLCVAFMIRFSAYILWINLHRVGFFYGCVIEFNDKSDIEWLCKLTLFCIMYSTVSSVWWMFVEGIYLSSRLSTFAMRSEGKFSVYCLIGWGIPVVPAVIWAVLMEIQKPINSYGTSFCWLPYTTTYHRWFVIIPTSFALLTNFFILMVVVGILVQKLWADTANEDRKLWKTIKATLLLVPLLGVPNLLLFYEPPTDDRVAHNVYMALAAVLQSSQGIFIATVYCFFNKDVRNALKLSFKRRIHRLETSRNTIATRRTRTDAGENKVKNRQARPLRESGEDYVAESAIETQNSERAALTPGQESPFLSNPEKVF